MRKLRVAFASLLAPCLLLVPILGFCGEQAGDGIPVGTKFVVPIVIGGETYQGQAVVAADGTMRVTIELVYKINRQPPGPVPPDPGPKPPPTPPTPVKRITDLYVVWETADASPSQAAIRNNQAWKDEAVKLKIKWGQMDADTIASVPKFKAVVAAAKGKLPCVVLVDEAGGTKTEPLPKTPADMLALVKKAGGQ